MLPPGRGYARASTSACALSPCWCEQGILAFTAPLVLEAPVRRLAGVSEKWISGNLASPVNLRLRALV